MRKQHLLGLGLALFTPIALTAACGDSGPTDLAGTGGAGGVGDGTGGKPGGSTGGVHSGTGGKANAGGEGGSAEGGMTSMGGMGGAVVEVPNFVGPKPCVSDKECTSDGMLCDGDLRVCVQCLHPSDCGDGSTCEAGSCVSVTSCSNSLACSTDEVCVKENGVDMGICLECGDDADCTDGGSCVDGSCRTSCQTDKECTADGLLCNDAVGLCTACVQSSDCDDNQVCAGGECRTSICEPEVSQCLNNTVVTCRADGRGYLEPVDCGDAMCGVDQDGAACSVIGGGSGGGGDAVLHEDFSAGPGLWSISASDADGLPTIEGDAACVRAPGFTLGWPSEGEGFTLAAGDYVFSFTTKSNKGASVEAKVAFADAPFQPVHFSTSDVNVAQENRHSFTFHTEGGGNVGLAFNVGGNTDNTLCFDNITVRAK